MAADPWQVVLRGAHARPWVCWEFQHKVRPESGGKFHPTTVRKSSLFVRFRFTTRRIRKLQKRPDAQQTCTGRPRLTGNRLRPSVAKDTLANIFECQLS